MPIDPVPEETCLQFVKGSHKWKKFFNPRKVNALYDARESYARRVAVKTFCKSMSRSGTQDSPPEIKCVNLTLQFATEKNYEVEVGEDNNITYEPVPDVEKEPEKYDIIKWSLQVFLSELSNNTFMDSLCCQVFFSLCLFVCFCFAFLQNEKQKSFSARGLHRLQHDAAARGSREQNIRLSESAQHEVVG